MLRSRLLVPSLLVAVAALAAMPVVAVSPGDAPSAATSAPARRHFKFTYSATIKDVPAGAKEAQVWIPLPNEHATQHAQLVDVVSPVKGEEKIRLTLAAYLGAPESYDSVLIEGSPRIQSRIEGGVHGDIATVAMAINAIPAVIVAEPGFRTMRDMRLPSFYPGV